MKSHDFLLELGTEELPPKLLVSLSNSFRDNFNQELDKINISFNSIKAFKHVSVERLNTCIMIQCVRMKYQFI